MNAVLVMGARRGGSGSFRQMNSHRCSITSFHSSNNIAHQSSTSSYNVRFINSNSMAFTTLPLLEQRISNNSNHRRVIDASAHNFLSHRYRSSTKVNDADTGEFFANPQSFPDFESLGITSPSLLKRLTSPPLGLKRPSAVQAAIFDTVSKGNCDVIVGAETGKHFVLYLVLTRVCGVLAGILQYIFDIDSHQPYNMCITQFVISLFLFGQT